MVNLGLLFIIGLSTVIYLAGAYVPEIRNSAFFLALSIWYGVVAYSAFYFIATKLDTARSVLVYDVTFTVMYAVLSVLVPVWVAGVKLGLTDILAFILLFAGVLLLKFGNAI